MPSVEIEKPEPLTQFHTPPEGIELVLPQSENEWHGARRKDITASVAAGLLNVHPYSTPYQLWAEKTDQMERSTRETKAMRRGKLLEPVSVQLLQEERPDWTIHYRNDMAYYRDPALRIGATPDVFAERPDIAGRGIVQMKTSSHEAFKRYWLDPDTNDVVPPLWIAVQAIIEAKLTGVQWASVGAMIFDRDDLPLHLIDIPINTKAWPAVVKAVNEFWKMVDAGEEPDPEWRRDGRTVLSVFGTSTPNRTDISDIPGMDFALARYERAGRVLRRMKEIRDILKPQIIYALGNYEQGQSKRFIIKSPTIRRDSHVSEASTYRSLRISKRKD